MLGWEVFPSRPGCKRSQGCELLSAPGQEGRKSVVSPAGMGRGACGAEQLSPYLGAWGRGCMSAAGEWRATKHLQQEVRSGQGHRVVVREGRGQRSR